METNTKSENERAEEPRFYFSAKRKSSTTSAGTLTYDWVTSNGNGMNGKSGVLNVPFNGTYVLNFQALANETNNRVDLMHNGDRRANSYAAKLNTLSMSSILQLKMGDHLYIYSTGGLFDTSTNFYTEFSGYYLTSE